MDPQEEKGGNRKLFVVFQPHQYNRTLELLEEFKNSFFDADILVTPDIYYSRDSKEDMEAINGEKFIKAINHPNKIF
jgi:UDP-N-acetylmuramate--alanine ligase